MIDRFMLEVKLQKLNLSVQVLHRRHICEIQLKIRAREPTGLSFDNHHALKNIHVICHKIVARKLCVLILSEAIINNV